MSRVRLLVLGLLSALVGVVLAAPPAQADTVTVHGMVKTGLGTLMPYSWVGTTDGAAGVFTGADASYSLPIAAGSTASLHVVGFYHGRQVEARSASFVATGDRTEDVVFPAEAVLRAHVREGDGLVSPDAEVRAGYLDATGSTSSGLRLDVLLEPGSCVTDADGTCLVVGFRGGSVRSVDIRPSQRPIENFAGEVLSEAVNDRSYFLAPSVVASGVVSSSDGSPLPGVVVRLDNSRSSSDTTDSAGAWSIRTAPGEVSLMMSGSVTQGGRSGAFSLQSRPFEIQSPFDLDLSLPALAGLRARVRDSLGNPVVGARVTPAGDGSVRRGIVTGIPTIDAVLYPTGTGRPICSTAQDGSCELPVLLGGTTANVDVTPPGGVTQRLAAGPTPADPTEVGMRLVGYATVPSAGSSSGSVLVTTSVTTADFASLTTEAADLPDGLDAVVGRLDYRVEVPTGGGSSLRMVLPATAYPNALLRIGPGGGLTDVTADGVLDGHQFDLSVVDGGTGDTDGLANGMITGNVVAVKRAPLSVVTSTLPAAAKGSAYETTLAGSGPVPPYSWTALDPLPPGLTLSPDGTIGGTPTSLGTWTFDVKMRESTGSRFFAVRTLSLTVATVAVATTSVPDAYAGGPYTVKLERSGGGAFFSWHLAGGALPSGLKLSSNGTLSGTPTTAGTYRFQVVVSSGGKDSPPQSLTLVVRPMEIATASLPDAPVGASYSQKLTTRGGAGTLVWSVDGGALPPGLTLSSSGTISGRPTAIGTYDVAVKVTDASSPKQVATRTLTIVVTPMEVVTTTLPDGKKGGWYSTQLVAEGGKPTLVWSLADGALPPGLNLYSGGRISGYPKATGTWTFTVRVQDASTPRNEATRTLTLTVT